MHHAATRGYHAVVSVGCNTPILVPELIRRVFATDSASYVVSSPMIGRLPAELLDRLLTHPYRDARRSMRGWAAVADASEIDSLQPVANINTPDDLNRLSLRLRS